MLRNLTLGEKLKDLRLAKGYKNTEDLANAVGIPKTTLNDYENDEKNIDVGYANLVILAKFYDISMDWLLGLSDTEKYLNTASMNLGLTDKTIDILQSKDINTRLLSEMIEHEQFWDLMSDIEIYIDGIISTQIDSVNYFAQTAKNKMQENNISHDKDYFMYSLEKAKINEDRYFHSVIHDGIDTIIDDLKKAHKENKKDIQVATDENLGLSILLKMLDRLNDFEGSPEEMKLQLFPLLFGVDLKHLNKQEIETIKKIIKKGEKFWKKA